MSKLIVVSNRVADPSGGARSGGLAVAVGDALSEGNGLWFGWSGEIVDRVEQTGLNLERRDGVTLATQALTADDYQHYYLGYANKALWPVFHYRLDLAEFSNAALSGYQSVNARFAKSVAALAEKDDLIWVHDYHLIPFAAELRRLGVENRIGFFLHIPFPSPEIVAAVPDHEGLFDTLFAYDVVGFQTDQDRENFERYVEQTASRAGPITHPFRNSNRRMMARTYPIGIDVDAFHAMANTREADERIQALKRGNVTNQIIGVERLDYSKGLPDRFRAFHRFLERYPDQRKKTVLMQIAPPTREELSAYADIRTELEQLSGAINGEFADFDWTPVRYIHRSVPRETLAALFRGSRVGLVTPLRDGMNLVAKEYVAAQDNDNPGVLILSQFAGAAADLTEALIVNPHDPDDVAQAMQRAVTMDLDERLDRHRKLLEKVRASDVASWRKAFLSDLEGRAEGTAQSSPAATGKGGRKSGDNENEAKET